MSQNERFSKKSQTSSLARTVETQAIDDSTKLLDALTFIESPQGLNTILYPVQRVIVRCLYGIPFDDRIEIPKYRTIKIWDEFKDNLIHEFVTEAEFLHWAYEEGKCNIPDWRDIPKGGFHEGIIFAGRRGGKSQLVAAIGAYELYRLLSLHNPQKYYDLKTSDIDFTFLAQDDKGASRLYTAMRGAINETPFFTPYIRVNTNATMAFVSEADRDRRDIIPTIKVVALPCTTNAVRGPSSRFLALDEFAHFASKKGATSEEVYGAATPATSNFVNPAGENEDMILCISSPWKKIGKMYDLYKQAMDDKIGSGKLAMNICTSIMNPRITSSKLHTEYKENTLTFRAEFGGSFLDSAESYVRRAAFQPCVDEARLNAVGFNQKSLGREFFWGLDLGMKNDATALAIAHFEFRAEFGGIGLVYDYIDRMMVGEKFEGPGIPPNTVGDELGEKYLKYPELPLPDVISWLLYMNSIMPCTDGVTDQHGGSQLVQLLQMKGILKMSLLHITPRINSQMFFALKGMIDNKGCRFPNAPKFAAEIGQVEAEMLNKHTLKVAAPMEKGAHDDMVDAVAMVAFVAQRYLNDHNRIKLDPTGQTFLLQEQQAQATPLVIPDISGASLRDVRLAERLARIKRNTTFPGIETTENPWNKKLNAGRRGRR